MHKKAFVETAVPNGSWSSYKVFGVLSVVFTGMLYVDIENALNAMNHRVIFRIMEICGFPAAINSPAISAMHNITATASPGDVQDAPSCTIAGQLT